MKIVCLSDTHDKQRPPAIKRAGQEFKPLIVPDGDILIHAGDFTQHGTLKQIEAAGRWLSSLPHKHKIFISGNHDGGLENQKEKCLEYFPNCIYLENETVEIEGLKIFGSPITPTFGYGMAFNVDRGERIRKIWDKIPQDIDILITHGPPYGILDLADSSGHVGCEELKNTILKLNKLKLHVFGHIHQGYGVMGVDLKTLFVNAAMSTRNGLNKPIIIDLPL